MAAALKRHSALIALHLVLVASGGLWLTWVLWPRPVLGVTDGVQLATTEDGMLRARLAELREELALTNRDLAAMGCSRDEAVRVLGAAVQWLRGNEARLEQVRWLENSAHGEVQEALRQVNCGPRDEMLLAQLQSLRQAMASSAQRREQLEEEFAAAVTSQLTLAQNDCWRAARANRDLPDRYRYIPNLSAEQAATLTLALTRYGIGSGELQTQEAITLGAWQMRSQGDAVVRARLLMAGVSEAEQIVFPSVPMSNTP